MQMVLLRVRCVSTYHEEMLQNANIELIKSKSSKRVIEKTQIAVAQQKKLTKISEKFLKDILLRYDSSRVVIREDVTSEQIVDHISGNKKRTHKAITILNKIHLVDDTFLKGLKSKRSQVAIL